MKTNGHARKSSKAPAFVLRAERALRESEACAAPPKMSRPKTAR